MDEYCPSVKMYNSFDVNSPSLLTARMFRELIKDSPKNVDFTRDSIGGISSLSPLNCNPLFVFIQIN